MKLKGATPRRRCCECRGWYVPKASTAKTQRERQRRHRELLSAPFSASIFCGFSVSGAGSQLFNDASMVVLLRDFLSALPKH